MKSREDADAASSLLYQRNVTMISSTEVVEYLSGLKNQNDKHEIGTMMEKKSFKDILTMTAGVVLMAVGISFFKIPNNFSTGGVSGIGTLLGAVTPLSAATWIAILNVVLLIIGFIILGRDILVWTGYCSLLLSLLTNVFERTVPLDSPLTDQPLMELIYAMMLTGIGSAMIFQAGATSGGTDITAMILKKYTRLDTGKALLCSDILIAASAFFVFNVKAGLFSILGLFTKAFLIDGIIESLNTCKYFIIITEKSDEISDFIMNGMKRGATIVRAEGAYSGTEKCMVHTVCKRIEAIKLRSKVKTIDENAFIIITTSSDIIGRGFRSV